jgi:hypothetical protein
MPGKKAPKKPAASAPYETTRSLSSARVFGHALSGQDSGIPRWPATTFLISAVGIILREPLLGWLALFVVITILLNVEGIQSQLIPGGMALLVAVGSLGFIYYCLRYNISFDRNVILPGDRDT